VAFHAHCNAVDGKGVTTLNVPVDLSHLSGFRMRGLHVYDLCGWSTALQSELSGLAAIHGLTSGNLLAHRS
jgi:hypothetical protein